MENFYVNLYDMQPVVLLLQVHLPNKQTVFLAHTARSFKVFLENIGKSLEDYG